MTPKPDINSFLDPGDLLFFDGATEHLRSLYPKLSTRELNGPEAIFEVDSSQRLIQKKAASKLYFKPDFYASRAITKSCLDNLTTGFIPYGISLLPEEIESYSLVLDSPSELFHTFLDKGKMVALRIQDTSNPMGHFYLVMEEILAKYVSYFNFDQAPPFTFQALNSSHDIAIDQLHDFVNLNLTSFNGLTFSMNPAFPIPINADHPYQREIISLLKKLSACRVYSVSPNFEELIKVS